MMIKTKITMMFFAIFALLYSLQCSATVPQHPVKRPVHHVVKKTRHVKTTAHKTVHKHQTHSRTHHARTHTRHHSTIARAALQDSIEEAEQPAHGLMSSIGEHMVRFVHNTISTLRYTAYKLGGTHFDRSKGVYIIDCSDYVDHLLQVSNPAAYSSLVHSTGSDKPTTEHYYHFFTGLTYKPRHYWNKIDYVKELQPGDILVFRNNKNSHTGVSGHVMVVMNKPTRIQDAFMVRVTDSASSGHSQDTRLPHTSGIGIGTMKIKVDPDTGEPSAYAWKLGSTFEHHVNFAMARPIEG